MVLQMHGTEKGFGITFWDLAHETNGGLKPSTQTSSRGVEFLL